MSAAPVSAREAILGAVRDARPPAVARPQPLWQEARAISGLSRLDTFTAAATAAGAAVSPVSTSEVARVVSGAVGQDASVLSYTAHASSTISSPDDPHALASLDVLVCESSLGVAENALPERSTTQT